jgi:hypothetical protein
MKGELSRPPQAGEALDRKKKKGTRTMRELTDAQWAKLAPLLDIAAAA